MSETPCCYCGREIGPIMASAGFAEYHEICHRAGRHSMIRLRAEYAALVAAHDAAMAEAERRYATALNVLELAKLMTDDQRKRADAAEAQLATAREDGARSMAALIAENMECYERGYDDTYDLRDRVELAFYRADGTGYVKVQDTDAVIAAWQAHETKESRGDD